MTECDVRFKIKLTVAVYKEKKLAYRNDMLVPTVYNRRSEARAHIKKEIRDRLRNSNFFISPRVDFDLVRYANEASSNTYLRYRIIDEESPIIGKKNVADDKNVADEIKSANMLDRDAPSMNPNL